MTAPVTAVLAAAAGAELEDWGPLAEATGEPMAVHGLEVWSEGPNSAGIWECAPGPSRWLLEEHEVIYVVAGRMTVTRDGDDPIEIGAGDVAVFPRGWSGTWLIHETIRKVYSIFV